MNNTNNTNNTNSTNKKDKLDLFIGPCVLESETLAIEIADHITKELKEFESEISITFKASYDKANRTSINSFRGPGINKGLKILQKIKDVYKLPILTDFHSAEEASLVAKYADVIQVPAFLCRQTDMILAGAHAAKEFNRILKIKKGQFLAPEDTKNIIDKATTLLPKDKIIITERGISFGYNNLIVDMTSFQIIKGFGVKTVYDATHSVQCPGGMGQLTGGKREFIEVLAKAALAAGAQGIFLETHPNPDKAFSDPFTSWPLHKVKPLIETLLKIYRCS
ncbi:MAG: 3-deoxy-8-phosphooctulonate synthase [Oligoflexia bacterium]|nr:3-deoxy-8-phosphooctulonate synthase [Oligoflexia bacterium]